MVAILLENGMTVAAVFLDVVQHCVYASCKIVLVVNVWRDRMMLVYCNCNCTVFRLCVVAVLIPWCSIVLFMFVQ